MRASSSTRIALATLLLGATMSGLVVWGGGFGQTVGGADLHSLFLPKHHEAAEALRAGRVPLWNPYELNGTPLLGWAQGSMLYPPVVLANLFLPAAEALQVVCHAHIAAMLLLFLLYVTGAGLGLAAAAAGAALAVPGLFNTSAHVTIDHPLLLFAIPFLPAVLLAWDGVVEGRRWAATLLALAVAAQWLPGYPEAALDTAVVLGLAVVLAPRARRSGWPLLRRVGVALALLALGVLAAGVQLGPLAEATRESARLDWGASFDLGRSAFAPHGVSQVLTKGLTRFGAAGLFCLLLGLLTPGRYWPLWTVGLAWSLFPTSLPFALLYRIPPYSVLRFAWVWELVAAFFVGVVAAAGVERLRTRTADWVPVALGALLAGATLSIGAAGAAGLAAACALASAPPLRRRGGWLLPLALIAFHAATVMSGIGGALRFPAPDPAELAARAEVLEKLRASLPEAPRIVSRKELHGGTFLEARLPSPTSTDPSLPPRRMYRVDERLGLVVTPQHWAGWKKLADSPRLAAAVGIGIVVLPPTDARLLLEAGYEQRAVMPDGDLVLYRRPVPRFHVVRTVAWASDEEDAFRRIAEADFDPWREVVVVREGGTPPLDVPAREGAPEEPIRVLDDRPERIALEVTLSAPGILVSSDALLPGWEARLDGAPATILRANYAFRALVVPSGTHRVELVYRPLGFRLGVALSLIGVALAVALGRRRRPVPSADVAEPPAAVVSTG